MQNTGETSLLYYLHPTCKARLLHHLQATLPCPPKFLQVFQSRWFVISKRPLRTVTARLLYSITCGLLQHVLQNLQVFVSREFLKAHRDLSQQGYSTIPPTANNCSLHIQRLTPRSQSQLLPIQPKLFQFSL